MTSIALEGLHGRFFCGAEGRAWRSDLPGPITAHEKPAPANRCGSIRVQVARSWSIYLSRENNLGRAAVAHGSQEAVVAQLLQEGAQVWQTGLQHVTGTHTHFFT